MKQLQRQGIVSAGGRNKKKKKKTSAAAEQRFLMLLKTVLKMQITRSLSVNVIKTRVNIER